MQHKEESRKPAGGCIASRQDGGFFFFMGLPSGRQQGTGGTPYKGGGGGL